MPDTPDVPLAYVDRAALEAAIGPLLRDEVRCRALLAATDAIVWTTDAEGRFVEPQPSWQAYTGQSWDQARGDGWAAAVHPDDAAELVRAWSFARQRGQQYHAACRLWHAASQEYRNCVIRATAIRDTAGQTSEWVGAVTDIHHRALSLPEARRLNDALKQQLQVHHEELTKLFTVSLDVMLSLGADGRLIAVSPSFTTVTGYDHLQAQGERFEKFLHPDDVARTWEEMRRVLTGSYNAVDFETRVIRKDGAERLMSWRAVGSAADARLYAVGRDITEKKESDERRARRQRLEALGQLTGGIAHDFNNILAALTSYLEVARRLLQKDPSRLPTLLDSALEASRRGAGVVRQLLTFARKEQLSLGPVDLNQMVTGMRELIERSLGTSVNMRFELEPSIRTVLADRTQLESVLLNLCINARDAMPGGGTLTIRTYRHAITDDPATRIDDLPRGDYGILAVEDTGSGMSETTLAHCLEPFFTTKELGKGTGLGLSQALGVAHQSGGNLRVTSKLGQGTRVEVVLPKAANVSPPEVLEGKQPAPPSLAAGTVLLVDDNEEVLNATGQLLEACGYRVIPSAGPEDAMARVLTGMTFDVLLTDYAMPRMTGIQLVQEVLRHRPKMVAVVMSGLLDVETVREKLPAAAVLRKPFQPGQLFEAIEAAVNTHRLQTGEH